MNPHRKRRLSAAQPEEIMDINTTPLIDVMLVLLSMLIITIPAQLHSIKLDMPVQASASKPAGVIRIDILPGDQILWSGQAVDLTSLRTRMAEAARQVPAPEVHIRPQSGASYATLAAVMASAQRQGLRKLGVIGTEQFAQ